MNNFQRNIYRTVTGEESIPTLEMATYSSSFEVSPTTVCSLIADTDCWVNTSISGAITTGDTVYTDIAGTTPLLGGNNFYKITLINIYIVQIDDSGIVSVDSICP